MEYTCFIAVVNTRCADLCCLIMTQLYLLCNGGKWKLHTVFIVADYLCRKQAQYGKDVESLA